MMKNAHGKHKEVPLKLILILADQKSHFGANIRNALNGHYRVLAYDHAYQFIRRVNYAVQKREPLKALVIYNTLSAYSFLSFWNFLVVHLNLHDVTIYYYNQNILHVIQGTRRLYMLPLLKYNDRELQVKLLLDLLDPPVLNIAKASS